MLFVKPKQSHSARILNHLKKNKRFGAYNHELAKESIGGMDWRKCISMLRKEGHEIMHVQTPEGAHKYYWVGDD